jgi:actin-like ATPase involved in cell morphogenesis
LRHGAPQAKGNFFVVSLGFGTCEAVMSTESGSVQRTSISTNGLRYAVNLMMNELGKKYYLELQNEHQLDQAFQKGFLFSNRKRVDLRETRERVLQQYYQDVISPALRKAFQDADFQRADRLYLVGGGAYYEDLIAQFNQEFQDVVEVIVPNEPAGMATTGYCINSIQLNNGDASAAIGIDLGNATTIVSFAKGNAKPTPENDQSEKSEPIVAEKVVPRSPVAKPAASVHTNPAPVLNIVDDSIENESTEEVLLDKTPATVAPSAIKATPAKSGDRLGKFLKTGMW